MVRKLWKKKVAERLARGRQAAVTSNRSLRGGRAAELHFEVEDESRASHVTCTTSPLVTTVTVTTTTTVIPRTTAGTSGCASSSTANSTLYDFGEGQESPPKKMYRELRPASQSTPTASPPTLGVDVLHGNRVANLGWIFQNILGSKDHPGGTGCSFLNNVVEKETISGLQSTITFRCSICNLVTVMPQSSPTGTLPVNDAAVLGVLAGGGGHATLAELCASLNMPCLSQPAYTRHEEKIGRIISDCALESMLEAGCKEKEIATVEGSVNRDGVPMISVIADGMWGKRSYRTNYNSKSGTAIIMGMRTKNVLFFGIRNKACSICDIAKYKKQEARPHSSFKNWTKSSTSMEADIIVEGFKTSMDTHGLIYIKLIGDGDSSVHKKLVDAAPYGFGLAVEKIECKNHLMRNYRSFLTKLAESSTGAVKILIQKNSKRLWWAATKACEYWHRQISPQAERIKKLSADLLNAPSHVFGRHERCAEYFCDPKKRAHRSNIEGHMIEMLGDAFNHIQKYANKLSGEARSLIHFASTNVCEAMNGVIAKHLNAKRINYSSRSSFDTRCSSAVVSFNTTGELQRSAHKALMDGDSPGQFTKKFMASKRRKIEANRKRRLNMGPGSRRGAPAQAGPDGDYGAVDADDPDDDPVPLDDVEVLDKNKAKLLAMLEAMTPEQLSALQEATVSQAGSQEWCVQRRLRLTAYCHGRVCRMNPQTSRKKVVKAILYTIGQSQDMKNGTELEPEARRELAKILGVHIRQCGMFVETVYKYISASPDGLIGDDTTVEIKCPGTTAQQFSSFAEAVAAGKIENFEMVGNAPHSRKDKHWYYQIQSGLQCSNKSKCILFLYTKRWNSGPITVDRDDKFWMQEMLPQLEKSHFEALLPEIALPRYTLRYNDDDIREAPHVLEYKNAAEKKEEEAQAAKAASDAAREARRAATLRLTARTPRSRRPAPVQTPVATTSTPVATTSTPVATTSTPVATTSTPVATTPTPVATAPTPIVTAPTPVATTPASTPAPVEKRRRLTRSSAAKD